MRSVIVAVILAVLPLGGAVTATGGIGRTPSSAELRAIDISVAPDGAGLLPGRGSSREGEVLYRSLCAGCHGSHGEGTDDFVPLAGGRGSLRTAKPLLTVGSYWPYATTVWDYIRRAMPYFAPGTLKTDEVYALTAFILNMNGIISADMVMTETTLPRMEMPNQDGFVADPRPDVPIKRAPPQVPSPTPSTK